LDKTQQTLKENKHFDEVNEFSNSSLQYKVENLLFVNFMKKYLSTSNYYVQVSEKKNIL
jgi:hypothetical protein